MTSWIYIHIIIVIISWYIYTGSLMMISLLVFSYHEQCCYFIQEGILRADFEATLWRHRWRHHHENTFWGIIWDDLFVFEVKLKLCSIFQNLKNGRHFELATNFFTGSYTRGWTYQKDSHEHFRHFEFLVDAIAQILTEIYQFQNLTYFVILWRHQWRHGCVKHNLHN